jgi:hypothetical protein
MQRALTHVRMTAMNTQKDLQDNLPVSDRKADVIPWVATRRPTVVP